MRAARRSAARRARLPSSAHDFGESPRRAFLRYLELKPGSINHGAVDQDALLNLREQDVVRNPNGGFQLFRIGDAVSSRNIHAAILDAYRLCLAI